MLSRFRDAIYQKKINTCVAEVRENQQLSVLRGGGEGEMRQDPRLERLSVTWCFVIVIVAVVVAIVDDDAPVLVVASRRPKSVDPLARSRT